MQFMGAEPLLACVEQPEGKQPLVERNFAILEYRADRNSEGLGALIALVHAGARGLASQFGDAVHCAAARADRAIGPMQCLKMLPRLVGVAVNGVGKVGHGFVPVYADSSTPFRPVRLVYNCHYL